MKRTKMTENAYLFATNLAKVNSAMSIVEKVVPDNCIDTEELEIVKKYLFAWQVKLFKSIKVLR